MADLDEVRESPRQPRTASTDLKRFSAEEKSASKLVDTSALPNPLAPTASATSGASCYGIGKSASVLTPSNRQAPDMEWDPFFGPPVVKGSLPPGVFPWVQCRGKTVSITPAALPKAPRLPPRSSEVGAVADRRENPPASAAVAQAKQPVSSSVLIHSSRTETNFVDIPGSSSMTWTKPVSGRTSHSTPFTIGTPTQVERDESMTLLSPSALHDDPEHPELTSGSSQQQPRVSVTHPSTDPEGNHHPEWKTSVVEPSNNDTYLSVHPHGEVPVPTEPLHEGSFNSSTVSHASADSREPLVA
jgi:hypothetical protein